MATPSKCATPRSHLKLGATPTAWVYEDTQQRPGAPCLSVPSGTFSVSIASAPFDGGGGVSPPAHDFAIYSDPTGGRQVYASSLVEAGQHKTFWIADIPAGVYRFQCDLHPDSMYGVLVVG
jgi:hypothetical protein